MRLLIALCIMTAAVGALDEKQLVRNYDAPLTKQEKSDISYIIKYLSDKPPHTLLWHKFSLEAAGARIEHIHPLRFFICVLTDEELSEGMKKIYRNRNSTSGSWVWGDFVGGIKESLKEEYHRNNLRDDQLLEFAKIVGVESRELFVDVHERKWTEFVVHLIKNGS